MKHRSLSWALILLVTLGALAPHGAAQIIDPGNNPHENVANRGIRAPGAVVRAGIASAINGPEITQPAPPEIRLRENLLVDLIQNLLATLAGIVPLIPSDGDGNPPPNDGGSGSGDVRNIVMTEIANDGNVTFVELLNRGPIQVRLTGLRFSDGMQVSPSLPVVELDRNATLVVQLGGETQRDFADLLLGFRIQSLSAGELALYDFSRDLTEPFMVEDSTLMIDYLEWSNATLEPDPPLESVAVSANLWNGIDFVPTTLSNMSFRLAADAESRRSTGSRDYMVVAFDENTLGTPESQLTTGDMTATNTTDTTGEGTTVSGPRARGQ